MHRFFLLILILYEPFDDPFSHRFQRHFVIKLRHVDAYEKLVSSRLWRGGGPGHSCAPHTLSPDVSYQQQVLAGRVLRPTRK